MRHIKSKLAMLAVLAGLQAGAQASLINPHEYTGAGNTWLQLTETTGLSINDILSGTGGWSTKYRFASASEVQALLDEFGLDVHDYMPPHSPVADFMYRVGGVRDGGNIGTWGSWGWDMGAVGQTLDMTVYTIITDGENGSPLSATCPQYTTCTALSVFHGQPNYASRSDMVGNFLVRLPDQAGDVPEPSTAALVGLTGLLLAARLRRARK